MLLHMGHAPERDGQASSEPVQSFLQYRPVASQLRVKSAHPFCAGAAFTPMLRVLPPRPAARAGAWPSFPRLPTVLGLSFGADAQEATDASLQEVRITVVAEKGVASRPRQT